MTDDDQPSVNPPKNDGNDTQLAANNNKECFLSGTCEWPAWLADNLMIDQQWIG